jgi:hypothetical protein
MVDKTLSQVFISYSHADKELLKSLKRHFPALKSKVEFWDDSMIYAGMKWKEEIENALDRAKVAILFLSADFFNSKYIMEEELPFLLNAEKQGLTILSVILKPCLFDLYPQISKFQAINSPSKTIIQMTEAEMESTWTSLIIRINELLD